MRVFITGGAGFVGSHAAEYYATRGDDVVIYDNLSRSKLLKKERKNHDYNWKYLGKYKNIKRIKGDILDYKTLSQHIKGSDLIIHCAAQTAVTTSITDPKTDFQVNAQGTLNVLEAARKQKKKPAIVFCSTNKVYGENVNDVPLERDKTRYRFDGKFEGGIPESFSIDNCEHTPYGCSKLTADLYMQDYCKAYNMKVGIFRMSCIFGERQFGVEDQGWVAWFVIAAMTGKPITIYGDGKQVRDVLYVGDLIEAFDKFYRTPFTKGIYNMGGGPDNTLSLIELLKLIEKFTGIEPELKKAGWRPSDQKVYVSNISKAVKEFDWSPKISPEVGVQRIIRFVEDNKGIF